MNCCRIYDRRGIDGNAYDDEARSLCCLFFPGVVGHAASAYPVFGAVEFNEYVSVQQREVEHEATKRVLEFVLPVVQHLLQQGVLPRFTELESLGHVDEVADLV